MKEKKPRLNPKVIREDDKVILVEPKAVLRVGYPKSLQEYQAQMEREHGGKISELVAHVFPACKNVYWSGARSRVIEELGYIAAKQDGFGGNKRDVFLRGLPAEWAGKEYRVYSIHTVMAGTREDGYSTRGFEDMYPEYTPPTFYTSKVWRLASIGPLPVFEPWRPHSKKPDYERETWIPVQFLRKVQP